MKRIIIWIDTDDKHHEEVLYKVKVLLSVINTKYNVVDILNLEDSDFGENSK